MGWIFARPLLLFKEDIPKDYLSLIGTLFTFFLYLSLLPNWLRLRWKIKYPWKYLGIGIFGKDYEIKYFLRGILYSLILISLVLILLFNGQWIIGFKMITIKELINAIGLIFLIGFVEELLFRGWLMGEMFHLFGQRKSILIQASIFSILHIRFQLPLLQLLPLLLGFFLLGIVLAIRRTLDLGSLWGCIGLHGGLVGIWFAINSGLIEFSSNVPNWLIGPGEQSHNPIGGIFAIGSLILIIIYQRKVLDVSIGRFFISTVNDSSKGALP